MSGQHVGGVFTVTLKGLLNIIKGKVMTENKLAAIAFSLFIFGPMLVEFIL